MRNIKKQKKHKENKRQLEWSKVLSAAVILAGFVIAQETIFLMFYAIRNGYTATAAWLTAAVGLAEVVIGTGLQGYLSLCKVDHKEGGITFEKAKAKNFTDEDEDSPI